MQCSIEPQCWKLNETIFLKKIDLNMFDTLYPTHICNNNKRNRNVELIKSFKTHLNKNILKG